MKVIEADLVSSSLLVAVIVTSVSAATFLNETLPLTTFATSSFEEDHVTLPEPVLSTFALNLAVVPAKTVVSPSYSMLTLVTTICSTVLD